MNIETLTRARADDTGAATVFLSYSREDSTFTQLLFDRLQSSGLKPVLDLKDIDYGEDWRSRLSDLIAGTDAFVLVLSPSSLGSKECAWELAEAERLGKRVIPVAIVPAKSLGEAPPNVARLNYLFFNSEDKGLENAPTFDAALKCLIQAIHTDIDWVRLHTRLGQAARLWERGGRSRDDILRGHTLEEAERWLQSPPGQDSVPSRLHQEFIVFSREEYDRQRDQTKTRLKEFLTARARALADQSMQQLDAKDAGAAICLAIEALTHPNLDADYPPQSFAPLPEAEAALLQSLRSHRETGLVEPDGTPVSCVAYAKAGDHLVCGTESGLVTRFDANTLGRVQDLTTHSAPITQLACGPGDDGLILSVCEEGQAYASGPRDGRPVWQTEQPVWAIYLDPSGQTLLEVGRVTPPALVRLREGTRLVLGDTCASSDLGAFSPDGAFVATGSSAPGVDVWDTRDGAKVASLAGGCRGAAFSPDGRFVALAHHSGVTAHLYSVADWSLVRKFDGAWPLLWLEGGRTLLSVSTGVACLIDPESGKVRLELGPDGDLFQGAASSDDGESFLTYLQYGGAAVHDADGKVEFLLAGHIGRILDACFSPDGARLLTACADGTARLWSTRCPYSDGRLDWHHSPVTSMAFDADGERVALTSEDGSATIWAVDEDTDPLVLQGHAECLTSVEFSPDGQWLLTASEDGTAALWSADDGQRIRDLSGHADRIRQAKFDPAGLVVAATCSDGTARLWECQSGAPLRVLEGHRAGVWRCDFSPSGELLVTGSQDATARVWRVADGSVVLDTAGAHRDVVSDVRFVDESHLLTASFGGSVCLWQLPSGELLRRFQGRAHIQRIAVAAGMVAAGFRDGSVLIAPLDGSLPPRIFLGHRAAVFDIAFNPNGRLLASASDDKTVGVWEVSTCTLLFRLEDFFDHVRHLRFSPRGDYLLAAGIDPRAVLAPVFATLEETVNYARRSLVRGLTMAQRRRFYLPDAPPPWYIERKLWPYNTPAWQAWRDDAELNPEAPLPAIQHGLPEVRPYQDLTAYLLGSSFDPEFEPR
jgi:WD40 repeat protein